MKKFNYIILTPFKLFVSLFIIVLNPLFSVCDFPYYNKIKLSFDDYILINLKYTLYNIWKI